jgi:hypothetical protein
MPANGVRTLRMSKKDHPMPKQENEQTDLSGFRGTGYQEVKNVGLDNGQTLKVPKKTRAFGSTDERFPLTEVPTPAAEDVDGGKEGKVRGRQADKGGKQK